MPPRLRVSFSRSRANISAFLLGHALERAVLGRLLHVLQALDRALDRLEVGQHAAEPALVDIGHAGTRGFLGDDLARLALGADEQDGAAVGRELADELRRVLVLDQRLLEVDDVDLVAVAEDERGHLGIPEARLVAEMDAGFQHLANGDRHVLLQVRVGQIPRRSPDQPACGGHPERRRQAVRGSGPLIRRCGCERRGVGPAQEPRRLCERAPRRPRGRGTRRPGHRSAGTNL